MVISRWVLRLERLDEDLDNMMVAFDTRADEELTIGNIPICVIFYK